MGEGSRVEELVSQRVLLLSFDRLDTLLLEPLEKIFHSFELIRRVPLPVNDLAHYLQRLSIAIRLRLITWELPVRQIGVVLDRVGRFHYIDPAASLAERQLCSPGGSIQRAGEVDVSRCSIQSAIVGSMAGLDQIPRFQVGLRTMVEALHTGAMTSGTACPFASPCPSHTTHGWDTTNRPGLAATTPPLGSSTDAIGYHLVIVSGRSTPETGPPPA